MFTGSSCRMRVIVMLTGSPSGSTTPMIVTGTTSLWFGGQSTLAAGAAALHTGALFSSVAVRVTVTVKLCDVELPCVSAAVHETVVVPIAKVEPDGGPHVTASVPSTASVAVNTYEAGAPE